MCEVTSIEDLKKYSEGQIVQLPDFGEGQPFIAQLRRPSMLSLVYEGKIPNSLIITANKLFTGNGIDVKNESAMQDVLGIFDVVCEACFVKPTYKEIKEAGITLTDEQLLAVFNYTQQGVKALDSFCKQYKNTDPDGNVSEV